MKFFILWITPLFLGFLSVLLMSNFALASCDEIGCFSSEIRERACLDLYFRHGQNRAQKLDIIEGLEDLFACETEAQGECLNLLNDAYDSGYASETKNSTEENIYVIDPSLGENFIINNVNADRFEDINLKLMFPKGKKGKVRVQVILINKTSEIYDIEVGEISSPKLKVVAVKYSDNSFSGFAMVDKIVIINGAFTVINENFAFTHNQDFMLHAFELGNGSEISPTVSGVINLSSTTNHGIESQIEPLGLGYTYQYTNKDENGFKQRLRIGMSIGPMINSVTGKPTELVPGLSGKIIFSF